MLYFYFLYILFQLQFQKNDVDIFYQSDSQLRLGNLINECAYIFQGDEAVNSKNITITKETNTTIATIKQEGVYLIFVSVLTKNNERPELFINSEKICSGINGSIDFTSPTFLISRKLKIGDKIKITKDVSFNWRNLSIIKII